MSLTQNAWRWHRWLGWIIGIQVLVWVTSGVLFAWLPFEPWVKAGDVLQRPVLALGTLPPGLDGIDPARVTALAAVATPHGTAWRIGLKGEPRPAYRPLAGGDWVAPDAAAVRAFAGMLVRGAGAPLAVERLPAVPRRLLIVDETGGRGDVWRVRFDDALGTRVYLDGQGGDFVAIRNEAWVWYDFFWRLHIMDYGGGEDFNNWLLRAASVLAWGLVAVGTVLAVLALRRTLRRRH
jgi:PepSY-associated TM region